MDLGRFEPIDAGFMQDCKIALHYLALVQQKYRKTDNERFLRYWQNCRIAELCGCHAVNTKKHGLSAQRAAGGKTDFLVIKSASFAAKTWHATFNDTTSEKAALFTRNDVFLAFGLWHGLDKLLFIAYGQNPAIGVLLQEGVERHKEQKTVRSTQSIALADLVCCCGFKIYAVDIPPEDVYSVLQTRRESANHAVPRSAIMPVSMFL